MSALGYSFTSPAAGIAVAADGNAHTLVQLIAPTNQRSKLRSFTFSFRGVVVTDPPIRCRVVRQTTAGTSTNANTGIKLDSSDSETLQTTARDTFTVEPTTTDVIWEGYCHPQSSVGFQFPISYEPIMGGGQRFGFEVLVSASGAAATAAVTIHGEE